MFQVREIDGNPISATFQYNTDLFTESSIVRMASRFTHFVEELSLNVDTPLTSIEMLPKDERLTQLHAYNQTAEQFSDNRVVPEIVEEQAERNPDAVALVDGERCWTYGH